MSDFSRVTQSAPLVLGEGTGAVERYNRRGEAVNNSFVRQACADGRMFCANFGTLTTPITFGATATIDVTKPAAWISVPSGTTIIPVEIVVYMEAFGTTAQFEVNAQVGTGGSRTSGGTLVTPANLRTDAPNTSQVTAYTGNSTPVFVGSTTNVSEFFRDGAQFAITKTAGSATASAMDVNVFKWRLTDADFAPVCVGASQLAIHQGSQAGTGYIKVVYIELPSVNVI